MRDRVLVGPPRRASTKYNMKNLKLYISIVILLAVPVLHFTFNYLGVYDRQIANGFVWVDNVLHAFVGIACGLFILWYVEKYKSNKNSLYKRIAIIATALIVSLVWEIIEWGILEMFTSYAKEYKIYSSSLKEAIADVVSNLVGGLLVLFIKSNE